MTEIAKENSSHSENNMDYSSLPPRGTIHKKVENNKNNKSSKEPKAPKWSFAQITLVVFLLLLVISPLAFYQLYGSKEDAEGHLTINTQNIEVVEGEKETQSKEPSQPEKKGSEIRVSEQDTENIDETVNEDINVENEDINIENELPSKQHVVAKGENLFRISLKYYSSGQYVEALARYNGLNDPNDIFEGLVLEIPDQQAIVQ